MYFSFLVLLPSCSVGRFYSGMQDTVFFHKNLKNCTGLYYKTFSQGLNQCQITKLNMYEHQNLMAREWNCFLVELLLILCLTVFLAVSHPPEWTVFLFHFYNFSKHYQIWFWQISFDMQIITNFKQFWKY